MHAGTCIFVAHTHAGEPVVPFNSLGTAVAETVATFEGGVRSLLEEVYSNNNIPHCGVDLDGVAPPRVIV